MTKTNIGQGKQALALSGGGVTGYLSAGSTTYATSSPWTATPGTAPSWTASTGTNFGAANVWQGFIAVALTGVYGVIISNTTTAITVDRWYNPATPTGAAGTAPTTGQFIILPGNAPCWYMGISTATSVALTDIALASEQTTNGLGRAPATFAHTFSNSSTNNTYTLTNTFTYTGSGGVTLDSIGIFDAASSGIPLFTTVMSASATVTASGDSVTVTDTITM
jgi:hypothetical protein